MPVRSGVLPSKAALPAGRIRPSAIRRSTFATLTALQLLPLRRGVSRWTWLMSSIRFRMPSIQPTQSASSTASAHVTLGRPDPFLYWPSQSSVAVSWLASNQSRSSAALAKNRTSVGSSFAISGPPSEGLADLAEQVFELWPRECEQRDGQDEEQQDGHDETRDNGRARPAGRRLHDDGPSPAIVQTLVERVRRGGDEQDQHPQS